MLVTLLALLVGAVRTIGVQLVAPPRCGGTQIITHAAAKFGRRLSLNATPLPVYAPRGNELDNTATLGMLCNPLDEEKARGRVVFGLRGNCEFARKAWHAEQAGAIGVVVVNDRKDRLLVTMKLSNATNAPDIPTVMVLFADWKRVSRCRQNLDVVLNSVGQVNYEDKASSSSALNWAMVRGIALWILCQCGVNVVRYKRRCLQSKVRKVAVKNMPCHHWCDEATVNCVICLESVRLGELVRTLKCAHTYHANCIDPWLEKMSNRCPICKRVVDGLPG